MNYYSRSVLFVCQTPLHLLLAHSISRLWQGKKSIVWISESDADSRLIERAFHLSEGRMLSLPGGAQTQNKLTRALTRAINVLRLRMFQREMRGQSLVVFNDLSPETQYLIESFKAHGGKAFLAEDGVATYTIGGTVPAGRLSRLIGKILYGLWWSPAVKIGLNEKITEVFASYPHLIRQDVRTGKRVRPLPLLRIDDIEPSFDLGLYNCLLCVIPLASSVTQEDLQRIVTTLRANDNALAIKAHPRESSSAMAYIESLLHGKQFSFLQKDVPIEALCMATPGIREVVGYRTSALHLIKFFQPDLEVSYIEFSFDEKGIMWRNFYKSTDIQDFLEERTPK